jgi:hypothetical protein
LVRLVASFATDVASVDRLVAVAGEAARRQAAE